MCNTRTPKIDQSRIASLIAEKKKVERGLVDPTGQISKLNTEIDYLKQKQQASRLIAKIKKYGCVVTLKPRGSCSINMVAARSASKLAKRPILWARLLSLSTSTY